MPTTPSRAGRARLPAGGQVLSLRLAGRRSSRSCSKRAARRARRAGTRSRPTDGAVLVDLGAGRLPARRVRRAPRRVLSRHDRPTRSAGGRSRPRTRCDLALYARCATARGRRHAPSSRALGARATRGSASTARVWLGARRRRRARSTGRARPRWLRATAARRRAPTSSRRSIKLAIGRRRPVVEDLPHLMATPTGLSFPSSHSTSSFAAARALRALLPPRRCTAPAAAMALSRLYLGVHYPSDVAAGRGARHAAGELRAMMKVGIVGMPNAGKSSLFNALSQAGAEAANYPFTTIEPNVAVVPVRRRAARRGGDDGRRVEHRAGHDRVPRHRRARRRRAQGRGARQPVPGQHPRDRRDAARRPRARRRERHPPRRARRPGCATSTRSRPS